MANFDSAVNIIVGKKPIPKYAHNGKLYVEGRSGSEYKIRVTNPTNGRILVVPSVDGLSTIDGKPAGLQSTGYVLGPYQTLDIPGWTYDTNSVGAFQFKTGSDSYVNEATGSLANAGVIGILVFEEKKPMFVPMGNLRRMSATKGIPSWGSSNTESITCSVGDEPLGTGWGQKTNFNTQTTTFERGNQLALVSLYYDSKRNLERKGIVITKTSRVKLDSEPNPFPGIGCKPPAGWDPR